MNERDTRTKVLGIIPARYASTRLPGKPLLTIGDKTIIRHVYERSLEVLPEVIVATDDERIASEVKCFGGNVVMTLPTHKSGTDRIREALDKFDGSYDVVINIQGDEPFVSPGHLRGLIDAFKEKNTDIATLIHPYHDGATMEEISNPNHVKVVTASNGLALYFSRYPIPYFRNYEGDLKSAPVKYYRHIGLYAFRSEVLRAVTELPVSPLEACEGLEQLRWLEAGYRIRTIQTQEISIGIDTPEDLALAQEYFRTINKR